MVPSIVRLEGHTDLLEVATRRRLPVAAIVLLELVVLLLLTLMEILPPTEAHGSVKEEEEEEQEEHLLVLDLHNHARRTPALGSVKAAALAPLVLEALVLALAAPTSPRQQDAEAAGNGNEWQDDGGNTFEPNNNNNNNTHTPFLLSFWLLMPTPTFSTHMVIKINTVQFSSGVIQPPDFHKDFLLRMVSLVILQCFTSVMASFRVSVVEICRERVCAVFVLVLSCSSCRDFLVYSSGFRLQC